jgi:hypothetical protein
MACLVCKYFDPIEPDEHKKLREAGQCEEHCGKDWNGHTAVHYVKNHRKNIDGWCRWNPEAKRVISGHVCAQVDIPEFYYNHNWKLDRIEPNERLMEWTRKQYRILTGLHNDTWEEKRLDYLEDQNQELRRQLEASRRISASRLDRLQKQAKPKPKLLELEPLPEYPRLVAAE